MDKQLTKCRVCGCDIKECDDHEDGHCIDCVPCCEFCGDPLDDCSCAESKLMKASDMDGEDR
jgi:hypothetical protein